MKKTVFIFFALFFSSSAIQAQTWEFVGLDSLIVKHINVSGDSLWAGTFSRVYPNIISGLYKSTDSGNSWVQIDTALGNGLTYGLYFHSQNSSIYLIKHTNGAPHGGLLYISSDNGNTWATLDQLNDIYLDWIGVSPFDENEIYVKERSFFPAGLFDTVYRMTDGGINWEEITSGFPASSHGRSLTFNLSLTDSSTLYASVDDGIGGTYFFKSTDRGDNWYNITEPPAVEQELITDPNTPNRIFIFPGYHLTEDDGSTWTVADSGLSDVSSYLSFYIDPSDKTTFYNLRKDGLYVTKNDPIYWQLVEGTDALPLNLGSQGFSLGDIGNLKNVFIDTTTNIIYIGTARGLYKKSLVTAIEDYVVNLPSGYLLYQNYPNPFNPSTIILYQIPERSVITIKVYNILGKELRTLVETEQTAGQYELVFESNNLPSGVYLYVLTATSENGLRIKEGKKMIIIK